MNLLAATILGAIQAATEFLPVSSTAHLLVFGELMGQDLGDARFRAFATIIQMGTTLAVIFFFREELWRLLSAGVKSIAHGAPFENADSRLGWLIVIGTIPAAVAGKLLERHIEGLGNYVIAGSLVVLGLVLALAEVVAKHKRNVGDVGVADSVAIGIGQAMALVPGSSRSGCTITTGMFLGLTREAAARYSFLLSVPITLGAGLYKLRKVLPDLRGQPEWRNATIVAFLVAMVLGFFVVGWLLRFLRTRTTFLFVVWRIVAGVAIAVLVWRGVLPKGDEERAPAPAPAAQVK